MKRDEQTLPQEAKQETQPETKRKSTRGEKIFIWSVYGGISWVVNAVLSVATSYALTEGRWKQYGLRSMEFMDRVTNTAPQIENGMHVPSKGSRTLFMVTALFMGGNLLTIPIRFLEGYKGTIVRWLDSMTSNKKHTPEELEAIHEEMDKQPKQSFGSLLSGRVVTLGLGLSTIPVIGKSTSLLSRPFKGTLFQRFTNMEDLSNTTANGVTKLLYGEKTDRKLPFIKQPVHQKTAHSITNMLAVDLIIGLFTATCFYISTRFFAKVIKDKKEDRKLAHEYRAEHGFGDNAGVAPIPSQALEQAPTPVKPGTKIDTISRNGQNVVHLEQSQTVSA